jgi:hypothetical protein
VIVRRDLPTGTLAAMVVHAAANSAAGTTPHTHAVVLEADEAQLTNLAKQLTQANIPHHTFRESDPPYTNTIMSIGIEPVIDRRMVRRFLRGLSLLR